MTAATPRAMKTVTAKTIPIIDPVPIVKINIIYGVVCRFAYIKIAMH
jgi:hypothetical protein